MLKKYIFFIKKENITPVSLNEDNVEIIIKALIVEGFYLSHLHILAIDNQDALDKYQIAIEIYGQQICSEVKEAQIC